MFKRILVLADNYQLTDFLLRYIPNVFPTAEYHVLSVVDFSYDIMSVTDYIKETLEESAIEAMLHCATVLEESGITPKKTILKGNFQAVVEKFVRENGIGLVANELYLDEEKKASQFSAHIEGLFKSIPVPIFAMDRPVELRRPRSLSILYTGTQHSDIALKLGLRLAKNLEIPSTVMFCGGLQRKLMYPRIERAGQEIGVPMHIDTSEYNSVDDIVKMAGMHDLFVTSRGGRSWKDRFAMVFKRLPLSRMEIETIMYVPVPMILVGETMGVSHG
jgi:hypothetical protein